MGKRILCRHRVRYASLTLSPSNLDLSKRIQTDSSISGFPGAILITVMSFFCCCTKRRRQYAIRQNPGVAPPLFGSAPPAYDMSFWTGNIQAQQPAPPYVPPANGYEVEANGNGMSVYGAEGYGYGQDIGGVRGIHYPPPVNQSVRPTQPPSYFKAYNARGQSIPGPMPTARYLQFALDDFLTTTSISATSMESRRRCRGEWVISSGKCLFITHVLQILLLPSNSEHEC